MAEQKKKRRVNNPKGSPMCLPQMEIFKLEEDDSKREIIGKTINNNLIFYQMGEQRVTNTDELCERLNLFFKLCAETNQIVTVEKMCLAIGWPRRTVWDWDSGRKKSGLGPGTQDIIKKAKDLIAAVDAELVMDGKVQPVAYIFRAKNFYGMADKVEHVIEAADPLSVEQSTEEIERKYKDVPIDITEYTEVEVDD